MKYSDEGLRKEIENLVRILELGAEKARMLLGSPKLPKLNQMVGSMTVVSLTALCLSSNDVLLDLKERVDIDKKKKEKPGFSPDCVLPADFKFPEVNKEENS